MANDDEDNFSCGAVGICRYIIKMLYLKYASSQNYYYVRDINNILSKIRIPSYILYRDYEDYFDIGEDQLKRVYSKKDYSRKIAQLTEYYKFHVEIPRVFCKDCTDTYFDYHDKKRQIEYYKVKNQLKKMDGEEGDSELALKNATEKTSKGFVPMLKLEILNEKNALLERKSNRFDSNLYSNNNKQNFQENKKNDKRKNDDTNETLQSIYKRLKRAVDENIMDKKKEMSAITFSNDITNNTHLSLVHCFENFFGEDGNNPNNKNQNTKDTNDHKKSAFISESEVRESNSTKKNMCQKPQVVFKKKLNRQGGQYGSVVVGGGGSNIGVADVFQEPRQTAIDRNFAQKDENLEVPNNSNYLRYFPDKKGKIDDQNLAPHSQQTIVTSQRQGQTQLTNEVVKHKKKNLSEITTKNLIQVQEDNKDFLDKEHQRLKEKIKEKKIGNKTQKTTKGFGKDDLLDLRNINAAQKQFSQNLHNKDSHNPSSTKVGHHTKNVQSARNSDKYETEMARFNNKYHSNQKSIGGNASSYKDSLNMKLFFDKKNLKNQVESQKAIDTPNNNKGQTDNKTKKILGKNLSDKKSNAGKVVKIYSARPEWPGTPSNQINANPENQNQLGKNRGSIASNQKKNREKFSDILEKKKQDNHQLQQQMQQSQNFDLRKSQKQYLDIGNFDEGINNPKKFATGQLIANEDALIDEQHSNPNKSTKTVQQHVYHTENHNNSTNHLKQKSSSNLNEFVIRKLSVNELQSDRSKVRFDSRKCSHENMSNTAKASNLKKKVVKSSRGSTGTAGFHSQKPSNHFETMHIGIIIFI